MITKQSIENLKNHLDVVEVVSSFISLKKTGANFKACCPFHGEETPSFVVSPSKQIYHCFGCGVGGDSVKFVMEYEKLSYVEAIEKLAFMNNFSLEYENTETKSKLDTKLMDEISLFFKNQLVNNQEAKDYLSKRGIFESSVEKFEIGYAPSSKEIIAFLKNNFLNIAQARDFGVIEQSDTGLYSRFVDRVMFPIYSTNSKIVGFGGRTLGNHQAKYINSPQTVLFNKSKLLYGYNVAKESIYKTNKIIVTEGYLDVIMLHQAGFSNAVATLGTALTSEHLPLIKRGEPRVIVAYDGDKAGVNAAFKAATLLSQNNISGGVVIFEGGMDPADMVQNNKIEVLNSLFENPVSFVSFVIKTIVNSLNLNNPDEKKKGFDEAIEYLKTLNPLIAEEYKTFVASSFGVSSKFVNTTKKSVVNQNKNFGLSFDLGELQIIKTIIDTPSLIDYVLDLVDEDMFEHHRSEFIELKLNNLESPKLLDILLKDEIKKYEEQELKGQLIVFLINFYHKKLLFLSSNSELNYKKKVMVVHHIREVIKSLKSGNLVPFNKTFFEGI